MANLRRRIQPLLGTYVEVGAIGSRKNDLAIDSAFRVIKKVHELLSFHCPASDLSRLNAAGGSEVQLHPTSVKVLTLAKCMTAASGGLFNCTVGGILIQRGLLPNHDSRRSLYVGDATDLVIAGRTVKLQRPVKIILDGIAKGFAVDQAIAALKNAGCEAGYINAGGDLRVFGNLSLPVFRREANGFLMSLCELVNLALATSQTRVDSSQRFPGVIVSNTGIIPAVDVWSVSAKTAWRADALTKVAANSQDCLRDSIIRKLGGVLLPKKSRVV